MKRFSIIAISAIATWGLAIPLSAQSVVALNAQEMSQTNEITPYGLVMAGYQGQLSKQGIPSGSRFITATRLNKIEAEDLVQSAIAAGRLSETTLNDRSYLYRVEMIVKHLART